MTSGVQFSREWETYLAPCGKVLLLIIASSSESAAHEGNILSLQADSTVWGY